MSFLEVYLGSSDLPHAPKAIQELDEILKDLFEVGGIMTYGEVPEVLRPHVRKLAAFIGVAMHDPKFDEFSRIGFERASSMMLGFTLGLMVGDHHVRRG